MSTTGSPAAKPAETAAEGPAPGQGTLPQMSMREVAGTPTFFINSRRHDGPQDLPVLSKAIADARAQAAAAPRERRDPTEPTAALL